MNKIFIDNINFLFLSLLLYVQETRMPKKNVKIKRTRRDIKFNDER